MKKIKAPKVAKVKGDKTSSTVKEEKPVVKKTVTKKSPVKATKKVVKKKPVSSLGKKKPEDKVAEEVQE